MRSSSMPQFHSQQFQQPKKADPITHTLFLTLEELYSGTTKRMRITKKVLDASGQYMQVANDKEISVKAGWKDGTKVTFEREGDEKPGYIPADICFVVQSRKHERFERDGDDLIYTHTITLTEALCGLQFEVVTLDNRRLRIQEKKVTPDYVRIISGEGMPNQKKKANGDLKVKFLIKFPELTDEMRQQIGTILKSAAYY